MTKMSIKKKSKAHSGHQTPSDNSLGGQVTASRALRAKPNRLIKEPETDPFQGLVQITHAQNTILRCESCVLAEL